MNELIASILEAPDDRERYLVYGDWLQGNGDPRGELVGLQVQGLDDRAAALIAAHRDEWLGKLGAVPVEHLALTWKNGFVRAIRIGPDLESYKTARFSMGELVEQLATLPHMELLERVTIGATDDEGGWNAAADAIATVGLPPNVTALAFDRGGYWDISSTYVVLAGATRRGDKGPSVYPRLATLRALEIELGSVGFGDIALPELRSLEVRTGGLDTTNLTSFRTAAWPQLERLMLCLGSSDGDFGCDIHIADLAWMFAGENLANVRHLGLASSSIADDIARALVGAPILDQLETLDLSRGTLSEDGIRALLEDRRIAKLKTLDLSHSYLRDQALLARLKSLGPNVRLENLQDDGGDPEDRYVVFSE